MLSHVMQLFRQSARPMAVMTLLGSLGCSSGHRYARLENERMDWMDKQCQQSLATNDERTTVARSQSPATIVPPPDITNPQPLPAVTIPPVQNSPLITPTTGPGPVSPVAQGEYQVRIVATIGTSPIYEREVREAVYQRLPEFVNLSPSQRRAKEQSLFKEELRRIVERELILDELFALLSNKKQANALSNLRETAQKDAEARLRDVQRRAGLKTDDDMKMFLQSQSLSVNGIRRQFERNFMMSAYVGERVKPKMNNISLAELKDYYTEHGEQFMAEDRLKWQDLFIRNDRFQTPADAKKYVEWILARVQRGEDFAKITTECDMGDSKDRGGFGFGEERGKIFPQELETTIFTLKQGQVSYLDFETGTHIVRIAERSYAGKKPFDEQVQTEIRRKLQAQISEREYKKIVDTLWRRSQPQILVD